MLQAPSLVDATRANQEETAPHQYQQYGAILDHDSDPQQNHNTGAPMPTVYQVYPQRWMVLWAFCGLTCLNNWIWITWAPLTPQVAAVWGVSTARVDDLSAVYMYVYIFLAVPALYWLNRHGLRFGLVAGGSLNLLGAWVRYQAVQQDGMDASFSSSSSYPWIYAGTVLCATCQTFTLAMPPLISTLWFRDDERGLATSLGVLANQVGSALGLGVTIVVPFTTPAIETDTTSITSETKDTSLSALDEHALAVYLEWQMILSAISLGIILLCVRTSAPPTPPSETAARSHSKLYYYYDKDGITYHSEMMLTTNPTASTTTTTPSYWESIRLFLSTRSGRALCVVYGLTVGVLYAMATFLAQLFVSSRATTNNGNGHSWTEAEVGYLGLDLILMGIVGSLLSGEYLDYQTLRANAQPSHQRICLGLLIGSFLSMVLLALLREIMLPSWWWWSTSKIMTYLATGLVGCFLTGFVSVGFEYGTAMAFPADEAAVAGVLNVAAQIGGWVLVCIGGQMMSKSNSSTGTASHHGGDDDGEDQKQGGLGLNIVLTTTLAAALLLFFTTVTASSRRPMGSLS